MNKEHSLRLLEILGSWREKELDRFWSRFNIVFLVESAFLTGVLVVISMEDIPQVSAFGLFVTCTHQAIAVFGIVVSIAWFMILLAAKSYDVMFVDNINEVLRDHSEIEQRVWAHSNRTADSRAIKASTYAATIPVFFVVFWMMIMSTACDVS